MKVLHVANGRLFGGIEQMLLTMAASTKVTPAVTASFAVASPGRLADSLRAAGGAIAMIGDVRLSRPASVLQARATIAQLLDADRPSVVICHAPWSFAIFGPVARRRGLPLVLWQHDQASGRSLVERWARRTVADLVVCNSRWTARSASAVQPGVPTVVIHPPVALLADPGPSREQVRHDLTTGVSDVVILTASRFEPWKGHRKAFGAFALLREFAGWTCWIAGGAQRPHEVEYAAALRREADRLGIGARVRFLGERSDMPSLMRASDLYVQMNERPEPFGVVFAEALLSGLPVVTADLGGAPEIVSNECGRLVAPERIDALADAVRELIERPELRARLGAAGRTHAAARCAPEVVLPQLARTLAGLGATAAA
jgi:glycosyltransferase involved in cell wall biosynthesis